MCSKKRPNNATSNYLISMRAGDLDRNSTNFLGKLRANFVGTEFQVRKPLVIAGLSSEKNVYACFELHATVTLGADALLLLLL